MEFHQKKECPRGVPPEKKDRLADVSFRSEELFRGSREIAIEHNSQRYRLQITRAGKLILTK
ncbi:MAG: hemin uptake protein HemP [Candidatus Omnitrophota bacterium]|jgi:hemin uptake protein HemP